MREVVETAARVGQPLRGGAVGQGGGGGCGAVGTVCGAGNPWVGENALWACAILLVGEMWVGAAVWVGAALWEGVRRGGSSCCDCGLVGGVLRPI